MAGPSLVDKVKDWIDPKFGYGPDGQPVYPGSSWDKSNQPPPPEPKEGPVPTLDDNTAPTEGEVGVLEGLPGSFVESSALEDQPIGRSRGPGYIPKVIGQHENWNPAMGSGEFNENYRKLPGEAAAAIQESGMAEKEANEQLAGMYSKEAERQAHVIGARQNRLDGYKMAEAERMAEIDQKSKEIAAHKVSTGRFWRNPGGIMAAIGAALISLAAGPEAGMKVINGAIERDLELQRQEHEWMQADKRGLETNVGIYRQLVGDAEAGDALQEAATREATAQKILEVSANLKSKVAIQNARAQAAMLMQQAGHLRTQVYSSLIYRGASREQFPGQANEELNYGEVYKYPGQAGPAGAGGGGAPGPGQVPSGGGGAGVSRPSSGGGGVPSGQPVQPGNNAGSSGKPGLEFSIQEQVGALKDIENRTGLPNLVDKFLRGRATRELRRRTIASNYGPEGSAAYGKAYNEEVAKFNKSVDEETGKISEKYLQAKQNSLPIENIQNISKALYAAYGKDEAKINSALGTFWSAVGADGAQKALRDLHRAWGYSDQDAKNMADMVATLQSNLDQAKSEYGKHVYGAMSKDEFARLEDIISTRKGIGHIYRWANDVSKTIAREQNNIYGGHSPDAVLRFESRKLRQDGRARNIPPVGATRPRK